MTSNKIIIQKRKLTDNRVTARLDDVSLKCFIKLQNEWMANPADVIRRCIIETYKRYQK